MTHFLPLKNVCFCTFACPRGDWDSHETLWIPVSIRDSVISGKVESSRSRAWTFRSRVRAGMRNRAHARAKTTLSKKSQNRKMGNEFIGFREICGRPDGAQKCQNTHYFGCKSVSFCISASALGGQKCEMTHFLPLKSVSFCTLAGPRGDRDSHETV